MSALVDAARRYAGTPFRHRGRTSRYLDCVGLVVLAYRDCGVSVVDKRVYGREPHNDGLMEGTSATLGAPVLTAPFPVDALCPGDVVLMKFDQEPHHMAIIANHPLGGLSIIHAHADVTSAGKVVEQRLDALWYSRITHAFRKPV